MRIRRKAVKVAEKDGVPPSHKLITCTYQKLFKRDGDHEADAAAAASASPNGAAHGTSEAAAQRPSRPQRHDSGSWSNGRREAKWERAEAKNSDAGQHGDSDGHDSPQDLHEARNSALLPKRRKVKSSRYAEFSDKLSEETTNVAHQSSKARKRSRKTEKDIEEDTAEYISTVANSKEALIASIFYVFDTLGKNGLSASEVVATMLEQNLPGLKEGGARHTVQVANVLRRSRYFNAVGNKQYLPCAVAENSKQVHGRNGQPSKGKHGRTDCKLYDGSGWHCPREARPAFSLCHHHLDMINRPFGKMPASSPIKDAPVNVVHEPSNSQREEEQAEGGESDSDREESEDIGPALATWGRDRTPGSVPNQKRKMLSLMSIK